MQSKPDKKFPGGLLFLLIVVVLYGITYLYDSRLTLKALEIAGTLIYRLLPVLLFVFALTFLSRLLIRPDWVYLHMGKESGLKGWIIAVVSGALSIGPVYPWYALLKELRAKGMRTALVAVFLYSRGIKPPLLPLLIHYFGLNFSIILTGYMSVFSLFAGVLIEKLSARDTKNIIT